MTTLSRLDDNKPHEDFMKRSCILLLHKCIVRDLSSKQFFKFWFGND